jgi:hypothetical protein
MFVIADTTASKEATAVVAMQEVRALPKFVKYAKLLEGNMPGDAGGDAGWTVDQFRVISSRMDSDGLSADDIAVFFGEVSLAEMAVKVKKEADEKEAEDTTDDLLASFLELQIIPPGGDAMEVKARGEDSFNELKLKIQAW